MKTGLRPNLRGGAARTLRRASVALLGAALVVGFGYVEPTGTSAAVGAGGNAALARNAGPTASATRCRPGLRHAVIGGRHRCLRVGQRCTRRFDPRYHRYGFHCHSGRLTRRVPPAPPAGVLATFGVPGEVYGLAVDAGSLWAEVAPPVDGLVRLDRATRGITARVAGVGSPLFHAADLWATSRGRLLKLDPRSGSTLASTTIGGEGLSVRPADSHVWVASSTEGSPAIHFVRVDPVTMQVAGSVRSTCSEGEGADFRVAFGSLWHACKDDGTVVRVDLETGQRLATIATGNGAHHIAVGHGSLWVTNYRANTLSRIDPSRNAVVATIRGVGSSPGIVAALDAVWAATGNTVVKIDPATNVVVGRLALRGVGDIYDIVEADGSLWASATSVRRIYRLAPDAIR